MIMRSGKTEKLAAIDIGTNSTRLLAVNVQISPERKILYPAIIRDMHITRLGKNTDNTRAILSESAEKTIAVIDRYRLFMEKNHIDRYRAVGTRALRKADNSSDFTKLVHKRTGLNIEIISGAEEASLSFSGAAGAFKNKKPDKDAGTVLLVIDIGGGSTELILGTPDGKIKQMESIDIGSVVLSEKFLSHKKPAGKEIRELEAYIEKTLSSVSSKINETGYSDIIGLGGTISALASIDLSLESYSREKIHGYLLSLDKIRNIYKQLCSADLEGRQRITGLEPARADIIVSGVAIAIKLMESFNAASLTVSESDILEGIIYSIF